MIFPKNTFDFALIADRAVQAMLILGFKNFLIQSVSWDGGVNRWIVTFWCGNEVVKIALKPMMWR